MPSNTNTRAPLESMGIIFIIFALGAVPVFADCDRWIFKKATAASKYWPRLFSWQRPTHMHALIKLVIYPCWSAQELEAKPSLLLIMVALTGGAVERQICMC